MKHLLKILVIFASAIVSYFAATQIPLAQTDIAKFFPVEQNQLTVQQLDLTQRYLFVTTQNEDLTLELEEQNLVTQIIELNVNDQEKSGNTPTSYLLIYPVKNQKVLLDFLQNEKILGPPVIGNILSSEFTTELVSYLTLFVPLIIIAILLLTSYQFLLNSLLEISIFSAILLGTILFFKIELNSAYLLSLLFVYIYIFTLINQLYFNKLDAKALQTGFVISISTTWLSGLLLYFSGFGLVSDFGLALMAWVGILGVYFLVHLQLIKRNTLPLPWFNFAPLIFTTKKIFWSSTAIILVSIATYLDKPAGIELNPLQLSAQQSAIKLYEDSVAPAQPFLIKVTSNHCSLRDLPCAKSYQQFLTEIHQTVEIPFTHLFDIVSSYHNFSNQSFAEIDERKFAQFKLANDMIGNSNNLFGNNGESSLLIGSVTLLEPIQELIQLKSQLQRINQQQDRFQIEIMGHLAMAESYQDQFLDESLLSLLNITLLLAAIFVFLFRKFKASVAVLPIILSLACFTLMHTLFEIKLSIISLIAAILFIGIVSDNLIHILLTYRRYQSDCFKTVFKPVVLSNIVMIASLGLMAFTMDGLLHYFGLEMAFLLSIHLMISMLILPSLLRVYLPRDEIFENTVLSEENEKLKTAKP